MTVSSWPGTSLLKDGASGGGEVGGARRRLAAERATQGISTVHTLKPSALHSHSQSSERESFENGGAGEDGGVGTVTLWMKMGFDSCELMEKGYDTWGEGFCALNGGEW